MYRLEQYCLDETSAWSRAIVFHKIESGELMRAVSVFSDSHPSSDFDKESEKLIDQFLVHEQKLDHLINLIDVQRIRLGHITPIDKESVDLAVCSQQQLIRTRMHHSERDFVRLKYNCASFIAEMLQEQVGQPEVMKTVL